MSSSPPQPPPPPPPPVNAPSPPTPNPPVVAPTGQNGAFLVELLIYNGWPFKDHWAFWVRSHLHPDIGVLIHATGDVRNGFKFEIKRSHDFRATGNRPTTRVSLQWVDALHFDERAMLNAGKFKTDNVPVCGFEASAHRVKTPEKSLNAVDDKVKFQIDLIL
ncbi:hypothetical protein LOZ66_006813 [Ophidiomyces ophidiicola]|nr:hypothetical protein LOZ66_006813 [Ophidiomyces ophidiicola]